MQPRRQATLTQPLQCILQHHVANLHVSTHMATPDDNNHAAIPMRSATTDSRTRIELRTQATTTRCHRTQSGKKKRQTDRSRTRRTQEVPFIAACSHFTRKNTRFRAPASSPTQAPCNIHAAITMHFAASRANPHVSTHMATPDDNNHAAIPMRSATTDSKTPFIERTHTGNNHSLQNIRGGTNYARKTDRSRTRRTQEVPFIAACSHFTRKNTRFRAPASSPTHAPCKVHAAITMRSAA